MLGTLRISSKYDMSQVRTWSLLHLGRKYPTDEQELLKDDNFVQWRIGDVATRRAA